jgi:hypothetical protein
MTDDTGTHGSDLDSARRAKRVVVERFAAATWWRGAGVAPLAEGWAVRLNIADAVDAEVPDEVDGVPVEVRVVGDITPQARAAPPPQP